MGPTWGQGFKTQARMRTIRDLPGLLWRAPCGTLGVYSTSLGCTYAGNVAAARNWGGGPFKGAYGLLYKRLGVDIRQI